MVWIKDLSWWPLLFFTLVYLLLLMLGASLIQWNFYLKSFHKFSSPDYISLSFDDGPAPATLKILDILKTEGVEAAFFCIGREIHQYPDILQRCYEEGHLIGNHSYNHGFSFDWQTADTMKAEIIKTNELIHQHTGKTPRLFRPPYGVTNPNLAKAIRLSGMVSIGWSLRSFDTTAKDSKKLLAKITTKIKGGDIILLHDTKSITADSLHALIKKLKEKGYRFIRLDKALEVAPYK